MSWTNVFPVLTEDHLEDFRMEAIPEEKRELDEWFGVLRKINAQPDKPHVVAFSLFWKNATAGSAELPPATRERMMRAGELGLVERFHPWEHYVMPLLDALPGLVERHPGVAFRIYLARDLDFLIDDLVGLGCEVFWMRHPSIRYCPGGLWRFLAYGEKGKWVTISDTDRIGDLDADIERTKALAVTGHGAWRVPLAVDFSIEGNVSYCPFLGGQSGVKGGMPVTRLMKAFVWHSRRGTFQEMCEVPGCGPRKAKGTTWPDYWFDQWFLTAAVFPRIAARGLISFVPTSARSFILPLDIEYTMWANPESEIVYFPSKSCCGGGGSQGPVDKPAAKRPLLEVVRDEPAQPDPVAHPEVPRIAFLFLTRGDVHQPEIWREYVDSLGDRASVFSHPKSEAAQRGGFLDGTAVDGLVPTRWGDVSLVKATLRMLEAAMSDARTSHFMLLSESCIPVRPADELIRALQLDPRSRIGVEPLAEVQRKNPDKAGRIHSARGIATDHWHFHDQWLLLDRRAAAEVLREDLTERFSGVFAADESYFGTVLSLAGWNMGTEVVAKCPTWTQWGFQNSGPTGHSVVDGKTAARIAESGCFFARKFGVDSDVGRWRLHLRAGREDASSAGKS
jgi:hypothetical protein